MTTLRVLTAPRDCDPVTRAWASADPAYKELLGQVRMHVFRGARAFVLEHEDGTPLTLHVGRHATNRRGAWGWYYNFVVAYTPPALRRNGYARAALRQALQATYPPSAPHADRLKSLAGSKYGVLLHLGLGHQFWGANAKGELVVDTPLVPRSRLGVPFHGRTAFAHLDLDEQALNQARPMSFTEIDAVYHAKYHEHVPEALFPKYLRGATT